MPRPRHGSSWYQQQRVARCLRWLCAWRHFGRASPLQPSLVARYSRLRDVREKTVSPTTLELAGYVCVLSNVPSTLLSPEDLLEVYRFRWQVELVFKRMKSLLHLDELPAKDPDLARAFIYSKLLAALMLEDLTDRYLDFSPWGYSLA